MIDRKLSWPDRIWYAIWFALIVVALFYVGRS